MSIAEDSMRNEFLDSMKLLHEMGFQLVGTPGTAEYYQNFNIPVLVLQKPSIEDYEQNQKDSQNNQNNGQNKNNNNKKNNNKVKEITNGNNENKNGMEIVSENSEIDENNTVLKWIRNKSIDLVINIPEGTTRTEEISAGYLMRRSAVDFGTSLLTNIKCATLFCDALHRNKPLPCKSSEEFLMMGNNRGNTMIEE